MAFLDRYQQEIRENAPVIYEGLTFHPLLVRDYDVFTAGKRSYELMLSSLRNPKIARYPWCACLWELDKDAEKQTGKPGSFLGICLYVMAMALRLEAGYDGNFPLRPVFSQSKELTTIMVGSPQTDYVLLNMRQMDEVRQIIAAQNGYDIPNESWNPELVRAAQENASRAGGDIEYSFETLIYSMAFQCRCRASDIYDWSIREFQQMQEAAERDIGYRIYTAAELSGSVKFKSGSPYPSWKFNPKPRMPTGFRTIADIDEGTQGLIAGT